MHWQVGGLGSWGLLILKRRSFYDDSVSLLGRAGKVETATTKTD